MPRRLQRRSSYAGLSLEAMKALSAKVLDSTHLELAEPLSSTVGGWVRIVVTSPEAESADWHRAVKERLLAAYDEQDSIYDDLWGR